VSAATGIALNTLAGGTAHAPPAFQLFSSRVRSAGNAPAGSRLHRQPSTPGKEKINMKAKSLRNQIDARDRANRRRLIIRRNLMEQLTALRKALGL